MSDGRYWITPPVQEFIELDIGDGMGPTIELPLTEKVRGWGPVHGGVLAFMADTCCAVVAMSALDVTQQLPATTDMHIRYHKQPREGPLRATGTVLNSSSRTVSAQCEIRDGLDRLVATATASYSVFEFGKRTDILPPDQPLSTG